MKAWTVVVVGGGYAGLHAVANLRKELCGTGGARIVWMDKDAQHVKKVRLVQARRDAMPLAVPLGDFGWADVGIVRGTLTGLDAAQQLLAYTDVSGTPQRLAYDRLVLALGSVPREPAPGSGGLTLRGTEDAAAFREAVARCAERARMDGAPALHAAVAGAGITGIELAAELAGRLRREAAALGLTPAEPLVSLVSAGPRLLPDVPAHVAQRLERQLARLGVRVLHGDKAVRYADDRGCLELRSGIEVRAGVCVWALGTVPNPLVRELGLTVHEDGRLVVDPGYRVSGAEGVYALGDCARVTDSRTGRPDGMTCKEAIPQAQRLARGLAVELEGRTGGKHGHESYPPLYCIGLGDTDGFFWMRRFGLDFVLTGKLGRKVREYTWNAASLNK
ncbi:FAD-dependent oxidoreductase [Paenibacillus filicis]|uniref:NADH:ubiquinone reductase (non-electrogenic) n=1 Tax=Paenibacillus gyeongsangnamensis TaxID=3388067 RepID=A0ABT4Q7R8_9BACL|nr:FAD-dependent oxidoreductase [Paenibacillus filicis]MCZ8512755.1 FAD-dependent oxidoreductase [Paenibacillus filicis]